MPGGSAVRADTTWGSRQVSEQATAASKVAAAVATVAAATATAAPCTTAAVAAAMAATTTVVATAAVAAAAVVVKKAAAAAAANRAHMAQTAVAAAACSPLAGTMAAAAGAPKAPLKRRVITLRLLRHRRHGLRRRRLTTPKAHRGRELLLLAVFAVVAPASGRCQPATLSEPPHLNVSATSCRNEIRLFLL